LIGCRAGSRLWLLWFSKCWITRNQHQTHGVSFCWSSRIWKWNEFFNFLKVELLELNIELESVICWSLRIWKRKRIPPFFEYWIARTQHRTHEFDFPLEYFEIMKKKRISQFFECWIAGTQYRTHGVSYLVEFENMKKKRIPQFFECWITWTQYQTHGVRFPLEFVNMKKKRIPQFFECWITRTQHRTHGVEFLLEFDNIKKKYDSVRQVLGFCLGAIQILGFDEKWMC